MLRKLFKREDINEKYRRLISKTIIDGKLRSYLWQDNYLDRNFTALLGLEDGEPKLLNFIATPNLLLSGDDYEKKGDMIDTVLLTLLAKNTTENMELYFFDSNGAYGEYKNLPHTRCYATNGEELSQMVGKLFVEMNRRHAIMKHFNMKKVDRVGYNHFILVFDDLLYIQENDIDEETLINLEKILSVGHLYGIHCVLNSSENITDIIDDNMLSNYKVRVALGNITEQESLQLLDESLQIEDKSLAAGEGRAYYIVPKKGRDDDLPDEHFFFEPYKMTESQKGHILDLWENGLKLE